MGKFFFTNNYGNENRVIAAILTSGFFSTLGTGLFSFAVPLLSLDEKISGVWLGSAFAGYYLAKLLVSPVSGILVDKVGPRVPLLASALVGTVAPLAYSIQQDLTFLYLIQFFMGLVSGLIRPVGLAALGGSVHKKTLSRWFALHALVFNVALFIGPVLGAFLYIDSDIWPVLLTLSGCMGSAACSIAIFLPKKSRTQNLQRGCKNLNSSKIFEALSLFLAICGRTLGIGLLTAFYPVLLATTLGSRGIVLGAVFAVPAFVVCLGLPVVGWLAKERVSSMQVIVGMLISAGALFALGACREISQFVVFGSIMGLGAAISIPSSMALASGLTRDQGKVFGLAHFAVGIGFLLGPLLAWSCRIFIQSGLPYRLQQSSAHASVCRYFIMRFVSSSIGAKVLL